MSLRGSAAARNSYLIAAICFALMALMPFPLVMSLLTSVKPAGEPAMWPPNYLPSRLSFSNATRQGNLNRRADYDKDHENDGQRRTIAQLKISKGVRINPVHGGDSLILRCTG